MTGRLTVDHLGRIDYAAAWDLQKELVAARGADPDLPHQLLLLEHPPTYTLGRSADQSNLVFDEQERAARGIALYRVDRGGDVTYHGPGQLVGYPILRLGELYGKGIGRIRRYVYDLEEMLIRTLAGFDISARRFDGFRGVWVEEDGDLNKIAAIGVYVDRLGISSHGFALNVFTDLTYFQGIIPCGINDHGVTSMSELLRRQVSFDEVLPVLTREFAAIFDFSIEPQGIAYAHD